MAAAYTINFDTPNSSSTRNVNFHGTISPVSTGNLTINLYVTGATNTPRAAGTGTYYRAFPLSNTATSSASYHGTYNMCIVPKVLAGQTVTATWGLAYN